MLHPFCERNHEVTCQEAWFQGTVKNSLALISPLLSGYPTSLSSLFQSHLWFSCFSLLSLHIQKSKRFGVVCYVALL